jgi:hypothetical protein
MDFFQLNQNKRQWWDRVDMTMELRILKRRKFLGQSRNCQRLKEISTSSR